MHAGLPCILALLVLAAPAQATFLPEEHVIEWTQHIYSANALTDWDGDSINITITRPHDWTVVSSTASLLLSVNTAITGSNQNRNFFIDIEGNTLDFCLHGITVEGSLSERQTIGGGTRCPPTTGGENQVAVAEQQEWTFTNTGAATVLFFVASIYVVVQETVTPMTEFQSLTGLTAFEFLIFPALAITSMFLWTRRGLGVRLLGTTMMAIDAGLAFSFYTTGAAWPAFIVLVFLFLLALAYMTVYLAIDLKKGGVTP